jgi:hypothetical protein
VSEPIYKLSDKALFTSLGDDIVALNVEGGQCYGMEKVSAEVWRLLAEPTDLNRLCARLVELYEVEPAVCRTEVERLIDQLRSEGLVETVPAAA